MITIQSDAHCDFRSARHRVLSLIVPVVMVALFCQGCATVVIPRASLTAEDAKKHILNYKSNLTIPYTKNQLGTESKLISGGGGPGSTYLVTRYFISNYGEVNDKSFDYISEWDYTNHKPIYTTIQYSELGQIRRNYSWLNAASPFTAFIIGPTFFGYEDDNKKVYDLSNGGLWFNFFPLWLTGINIWYRNFEKDLFWESLEYMRIKQTGSSTNLNGAKEQSTGMK